MNKLQQEIENCLRRLNSAKNFWRGQAMQEKGTTKIYCEGKEIAFSEAIDILLTVKKAGQEENA